MDSQDSDLERVLTRFTAIPGLSVMVGKAIRQALNEVIDGARTKRYRFEQLDKEEKTYIGKKIEIILRDALGLPKGHICDLDVDGIEVDIKWSASGHWMIPRENIDQICLVITATENEIGSTFNMGLIRTTLAVLNIGKNQDQKRTISAVGMRQVRWLFQSEPMPSNFLLQLPSQTRETILSQDTGQARISELFRLVQMVPIPREAIEAIGNQRDTAKRIRDARLDLNPEGIKILSGKYGRLKARDLGLPIPELDEFISYSGL